MTAYNIYSYENAQESASPLVTVEVSDDGTSIASVTSSDPEVQTNAERMLNEYVAQEFTPEEAIERFAGPYGEVREVEMQPAAEAPAEEAPEPAPEAEEASEPVAEEDVVAAAAEADVAPEGGAVTFSIPEGTMAMTNDEGTVITLLQRDPEQGAVIRVEGEWVPVTDPETLEGLNFVGVDESAVALYDEHETAGNLVPIQYYPASEEGPYWPDPVVVDDENLEYDDETGEFSTPVGDAEPLAASITLNRSEDLDAAISAALIDPEMRWYVERRVAALGLKADLPWLRG